MNDILNVNSSPPNREGAESDLGSSEPVTTPPCYAALPQASGVVPLMLTDSFISVVTLPGCYGLLPLTLSVAQVGLWTGLGRTKVQELINASAIVTAKVDGRTLVLTNSVLALIERCRTARRA